MRTSILFLSLAAIVVACSEQQPTSPAAKTPGVRPQADASPSGGAAPAPQAKPVDQVGFTKAALAFSDLVTVAVGEFKDATAYCPAGAAAVGGGYQTYSLNGGTQPIVFVNRPANLIGTPTGWLAGLTNNQAGAAQIYLRSYAVCVS